MNNQKKRLIAICLFMAFCGLIGIVAYAVVTPEFIAEYYTIDGALDLVRIEALHRLRVISLVIGMLIIFFSVTLVLLQKKGHSVAGSLQRISNTIFSFDLNETVTKKWNSITPANKKLFAINIFIVFLSHGFVLNNLIINWDGQGGLSFSSMAHLPSGRWFTAFLGVFSEHTFLPIPFTVVSFLCLALAGILFADFWGEKTTFQKALLSAVLITFPSFAAGFSYNWVCAIYPISCVLTLLAIKYILKPGHRHLVGAIVLFVLMLGTYQGFIAFGYAMMLVTFLINVFERQVNLWFMAKRFMIIGLLAPPVYKLLSDIILYFLNIEYYDYRGANQIGFWYIIDHFPENLLRSYSALQSFLDGEYFSMPFYLLSSILILFLLLVLSTVPRLLGKQFTFIQKVLVLILLIIAPPLIFATQFLNTYIDSLLIFGLIPAIGGAFYFVSKYNVKLISSLSYLIVFILLIGFVNRSNAIHLKNYLWTETSLRLATDVALRISALPDFTSDLLLVRYGNFSTKKFPLNKRAPFNEQGMTMVTPTGLGTYGESRALNGMMSFLGFSYQTANWESVPEDIKQKVGDMPTYPEDLSVQIFGNYVIVKLSD